MFNIGPFELIVLVIIGVVVLGPERLPGLARDAAQMLRTLRELATGAREQLRDELGPEFADVDLRNLNPRTALTRAVFGDDEDLESLRRMDPRRWNAKDAARNLVTVPDEDKDDSGVSFDKGTSSTRGIDVASGGIFDKVGVNGSSANGSSANGSSANGSSANGTSANGTSANGSSANGTSANGSSANGSSANGSSANGSGRPRPRPRPAGGVTPYDSDAT